MNPIKTIAIGLLSGLCGSALFAVFEPQPTTQSPQPASLPLMSVSNVHQTANKQSEIRAEFVQNSFEYAAGNSIDAVVHVRTSTQSRQALNPWHELLGYPTRSPILEASGSGVIIDPSGFIVTNHHVIEGADKIEVSLNNNRTYEAQVIGADPSTDIAVLQIFPGSALPCIEFGSSDDVNIGEWVLAVGNPFDLTSTVTAGIVSAKARNINLLRARPERGVFPIESFIQTDAAVNPGNSGGALVNTKGELIGINTAIASRTGSYAGYAFAVPSTIVRKVSQDLMLYGEVQRAYLGIQIEPVNQQLAKELALDEVAGCSITAIVPGSGAADSEVQVGDIVLAIDGIEISDFPELQECMSRYRPGETVVVRIWRELSAFNLTIQLKDRNGQIAEKLEPTLPQTHHLTPS
jgi:S1-C subfamily serine protease